MIGSMYVYIPTGGVRKKKIWVEHKLMVFLRGAVNVLCNIQLGA